MFQKDRWKLEELGRKIYDLWKTTETISVPFCSIVFLGTQISFNLAFFSSLVLNSIGVQSSAKTGAKGKAEIVPCFMSWLHVCP